MIVSPSPSGMRRRPRTSQQADGVPAGFGRALPRLLRRAREGVSEAVHRPHEPRLARRVADRGADLGEKARQRAVGDERARPELFVDLLLRNHLGPLGEEKLQELKGLRLQVNGLPADGELSRPRIEHAVSEPNSHRPPGRKAGTSPAPSQRLARAPARHRDYRATEQRRFPMRFSTRFASVARPLPCVHGPHGADARGVEVRRFSRARIRSPSAQSIQRATWSSSGVETSPPPIPPSSAGASMCSATPWANLSKSSPLRRIPDRSASRAWRWTARATSSWPGSRTTGRRRNLRPAVRRRGCSRRAAIPDQHLLDCATVLPERRPKRRGRLRRRLAERSGRGRTWDLRPAVRRGGRASGLGVPCQHLHNGLSDISLGRDERGR